MLCRRAWLPDELIRVVDEGLEQAQKSKVQLDTDLEALEKVLQTVPKGFILNLAEVEEAYAQAGATRQTVVTEVREKVRQPFGCISVLIE